MKSIAISFLFGGSSSTPTGLHRSFAGGLKRHLRERAEMRRLHALDDRMLADIGLNRDSLDVQVIRDGRRY
ncbi:MAG: DUF1127 domain-containing protein [Alphaproteobacteria bacterium]|nr:DUF1127 domain-containing protein [Alphaproteobacteria bacterium]